MSKLADCIALDVEDVLNWLTNLSQAVSACLLDSQNGECTNREGHHAEDSILLVAGPRLVRLRRERVRLQPLWV